jgi:hypothetical protein
MSCICWSCLLSHYILFGVLFIYLFIFACFRSPSIGADDFENLQKLDSQDFEQQAGQQGKWPLTILILCALFLSSWHIGLHALILLPRPYTFWIWVYTWLVMLNHGVLNAMQVFHLYDVEFDLCLGVRDVVSHPLRCDLTMRIDVVVWEMVGMVEMVNTIMSYGARIY